MLISQTDTITINQATMMQEKLHPELWVKTYHLEGKLFFKGIQRRKRRETHYHIVSSYDYYYTFNRLVTIGIINKN